MGNGQKRMTTKTAIKLQIGIPLVWRIIEVIALWCVGLTYNYDIIKKDGKFDTFLDEANWYGSRNPT